MGKVQKFVVRGKEVFVGLEDSKRTWKLCVRCERMIVHEVSMPTEYDNLRSYFQGRYPNCEIQVMYEAGFQGFWLHDLLEQDGIRCVVTPASKVTQEKVNLVKTDKVDARRLAKNLENGDYKSCHVPDQELREDRQISRTLNQTQCVIVATRNRIRKFLDLYNLNGGLPAGKWKDSHYKIVRGWKFSSLLQVCMDTYFELLDKLVELRTRLQGELKNLCKKERYSESVEIKDSFPGIGWLSAIRFTLEWGDMSRFPGGEQIASFVGFTSREHSTGETIHRGRITKQGNGQVRGWLIQCAWRAIRQDPALLSKFLKVRDNSGSRKKAIVAVARKMVVRMRALELAGERYQCGVIR